MQIFIIGKTKSGKSAFANLFKQEGFSVFEAGAWAREGFSKVNKGSSDELSAEFKENLTNYALLEREKKPHIAYDSYVQFLIKEKTSKIVICGVRSLFDFQKMLDLDHEVKVIFIDSEQKYVGGSVNKFELGIDSIRNWVEVLKENYNLSVYDVTDKDDFKVEMKNILP